MLSWARFRRAATKKIRVGTPLLLAGALTAGLASGPSPAAADSGSSTPPAVDNYDTGHLDFNSSKQWITWSPWGVQGRHDLCHLGNYLFVLQPYQQAALRPLLAGSDADRAANIDPTRSSDDAPNLGTASQQDHDAFVAWVAKVNDSLHAHQQVLLGVQYLPRPEYIDPSVGTLGWTTVPDFSQAEWDYRFHSQSGYPDDSKPPQADQAALDRVKAIMAADPSIPGFFDPGSNAFDVADFITRNGPAKSAPAPGSIEFRTDVENLKVRWGACATGNPADGYDVLRTEVETASAEWQAELASQSTQRDDIVGAFLASGADLSKASDAMIEADRKSVV